VKSVIPDWYCVFATFRDPSAASALWRKYSAFDSRLDEGRNPVVHLLLCSEHGVLVVDQQLLQLCILQTDVVGDLAIIQDVPLERGTARMGDAG
jgi:hypothetical protein